MISALKPYFFIPAAFALAACSSHDEPAVESTAVPANFTASIAAPSRAYDQTWEAGDEIGISCRVRSVDYKNVAYANVAGTDSFAAATPGKEILINTLAPVTFTAYYPYSATADNSYTIAASTLASPIGKDCDFLWAQAQGGRGSHNVNIVFSHKMTKVNITLTKDESVTFEEIKAADLSLSNIRSVGEFDVTSGVAAAIGAATDAWKSNSANAVIDSAAESITYSFIAFPQTFAAPLPLTAATAGRDFATQIDFTAGNAAAGDAEPKNEWVAGRQYSVTIILQRTLLALTGCTITAWEEVAGGNVNAE